MNRNRRPHPILALVLVALLAGFVPSARAQTTDMGALQAAIERNAELLAEARVLVRETGSAKARTALEAAARMHELSMRMMSAGDRPMMIARTVKRAREAILNVIQLARREARLEENALRAIERAGVRLEQAQGALDGADAASEGAARRLVDEAQAQLERSRAAMQEHLFGVALRLARASHDMSSRALRMVRRDASNGDRLRAEIERTDRVLERAIESAGEHPGERVRRALDEARNLQERARRQAREHHARSALEATRRARRIALRVAGATDRPADADRVARALEKTDELVAEARRALEERHADRELAGRLDRADALQREAHEHLERGDLRGALERTRRARDIAQRVLASAGERIDADGVARLLDGTDAALARAREAVSASGDERARDLLERAESRQLEARRAFDAGDLRRAAALTRDARDLARRAIREAAGAMR